MRVLLWHVHGSWATAFVQGPHEYVVPVTPDRGPDGLGRARTWDWPASVVEVPPEQLAEEPIDVVLLQRPHEVELAARWLGRRPGIDVPAVFVEHNTPVGDVPCTRHVLADQRAIPIVHVTAFNELMWDCGDARTTVIEHGVIDPGDRYTGEVPRAGVVVNEPVRRGRFVGTDLIREVSRQHGIDLFGMKVDELATGGEDERSPGIRTYEDLPQSRLHEELPQRAVYLHTPRWTSLGLSLIEAMMLGMPVVAVGTTEAPVAVPTDAGALASRAQDLSREVRRFLRDPELARASGKAARAHALERYGVDRFLRDWDELLADATR
ncbi:glycosyltransferase [Nocardioides sp. SYSU DS0651]|uniref:glycosyltransferase n=1 Tax=Nocardioides sp. SYSU DS0651 TaxID=3415955 RepID=UPI003F4B2A9B